MVLYISRSVTEITCGSFRSFSITSGETTLSVLRTTIALPSTCSRLRWSREMLTPLCAEGRADVADDAGLVLVEQDEHPPFRDHLDREFVDPHDPRLLAAEDGARDVRLALGGLDRDGDHARVVLRLAALRLDDLDAPLLGDQGGVDVVDALVEDRGEEPLEERDGDRGDVVVEDLPAVLDHDLLDGAGDELRLELPQLLREGRDRGGSR